MGIKQKTRSETGAINPEPDVPIRVDTFRASKGGLSAKEAENILREVWRLTQNPRLLEIEYAHRGGTHDDLQLETHIPNEKPESLNRTTTAAKSFIKSVRKNHPLKLACSPRTEDL